MSGPEIRALVVEDEPHARQSLREYAADVPWLRLVGEAADGTGALEAIDRLAPDLVFLDVRLPELSGLEVLARISHRPEVVFTTAYDRFALEAFELGALDYLLKPFGRQRFVAALERVRERMGGARVPPIERALGAFETPARRLFARTREAIVPIAVETIVRLQARDDYVEVSTTSGRHLLHVTLSGLLAKLDPERFRQVHRSHAVNLDFVDSLRSFDDRRLSLRLRDGTEIVASRAASEELRRLVL